MFKDLLIILYSWLFLSVFQFISIPILRKLLAKELFDHGWGMGRIIGWLMMGLPIWFLGHAGIPANSKPGIFILLIIYFFWWIKEKKENIDFLQNLWSKKKNVMIFLEFLFLFGIVFLSVIRGFSPDINGLEKFMDGGLMQSYMISPTLPIKDMWLAGENFNYYTFGHYLGALATQFLSLDLSVGYNIMLGFLMGLTLSGSASIAINLTAPITPKIKQRVLIFSGLISAFLVTFGGNTQSAWYFLKNKGFARYWYPDATRFIPNTIHEFPAYSFIVSDLHAHVWTIPIALLSIVVLFIWSRRLVSFIIEKEGTFPWISSITIGALLGVMMSSSTWSGIVYTLFLCEFSALIIFWQKLSLKTITAFIQSAIVIIISLILIASPWLLNFQSISEGVRLVTERTELWQLLVLWIGHASITLIALGFGFANIFKQKISAQTHLYFFIIGLSLTAITLLILPEIIYFKDIYSTQPRANTMFKLTFESFVIMSLVAGWLAGYLKIHLQRKTISKLFMILFLVFLVAVGIYPYFGYRDFYLGTKQYKGLDGLSWLQMQYPDDYQGLLWIKKLPDQPIVLEAVGDSYTTFARISAFSGKPTVLGWRVHEWLWRGGYDIPGQRSGEVEQIYNLPTSSNSQRLLNQYQVSYIFVGDKEREAYPNLDEQEIKKLGKTVFQSGKTFIIER